MLNQIVYEGGMLHAGTKTRKGFTIPIRPGHILQNFCGPGGGRRGEARSTVAVHLCPLRSAC